MPLKIVRKNHVLIPGRGFVLLTTPHAISAEADLYLGQIVEDAALLSKCFAVIGKASREFADPTTIQVVRGELGVSIQNFLQEDGLRCIVDVRGKMEPGVRLSSERSEAASQSLTDIIETRLARDFRLNSKTENEHSDPAGVIAAFTDKGSNSDTVVETVRIEFGLEEKVLKRDQIVGGLADIVGLINQKLGYSESDQGTGYTLG